MLHRSHKTWLMSLTVIVGSAVAIAGCTPTPPNGGDPENADLTYWYWAESDVPGANDWMKERVAEYEILHSGVTIELVPQSSDTLIGSFEAAAQTKSGPDIATLWATMPVLTQAWAGAIVPINDYVSKDKMSTWIGAQENTDKGNVWGVPLYVMGIPLAYNKDLFGQAGIAEPPATFDDLLSACSALKDIGVTPIGMGNKDGYFGAWFFSNFGKQNLDSTDEFQNAIIGNADIADPKYTGYLDAMYQLASNNCLNDDISSLTTQEGFQVFAQGEAAMAWGPDGVVSSWAETLGEDTVGVVRTPKWGSGELADVHNTTQSSSAIITSWSKNPQAAAQFLTWLHEPANLASWYDATGVFPADTKFDSASIDSDLARTLWELNSSPGGVWLQNYVPPAIDADGNLAAGQVITSGGSVADAVGVFEAAAEKWRQSNPADFESYSVWTGN